MKPTDKDFDELRPGPAPLFDKQAKTYVIEQFIDDDWLPLNLLNHENRELLQRKISGSLVPEKLRVVAYTRLHD